MAELDCQPNESKNEFLKILASPGVGFLLSGKNEVSLLSCDGKMICLFFSANWCRPCKTFTPNLVQLYNTLQNRGENLEIIFISLDHNKDDFEQYFSTMPWLAASFDIDTNTRKQLCAAYRVNRIPSFVPLYVDRGMAEELDDDLIGFIEDYGVEAFPFTRKRRQELRAMDMAKRKQGTLEELLGHGYVASGHGVKVPISQLVDKTIGLYFGAYWSPPSLTFTAKLAETYTEIIANNNQSFEIIFVSTDRNDHEFELNLTNMPWLAIPYNDETRKDLYRIFDIKGIPSLVLIGRDDDDDDDDDEKSINENGRGLVWLYGAEGFPFTKSRIGELEAAVRKQADGLASNLEDVKHEHELKLELTKGYLCNFCKREGRFWAFSCDVCDFDLHPSCVQQRNM